MDTFDVYIRISKEGDRTPEQVEAQLDEYEKACRKWAEGAEIEVGEVVRETDVSGSVKVAERKLDELIRRVESKDSQGILTTHLDRFGRDTIEGCVALKRIVDAGGRLVCCEDGVDTAQPGSKLVVQLRLAIAEDYLDRVRSNFVTRQNRAAREGIYLAARVPVGLARAGNGQKVEKDERLAPMIVELYEMRADGAGYPALIKHAQAAYGVRISKSNIRYVLRNRAYVGEMTVQTGRKGETRVEKDAFPAILTEAQFQAAQVGPGTFFPRNGASAAALLRGLVWCASCGVRCKVGISGRPGKRKPCYVCTTPDCTARVAMNAERLDPYVTSILDTAILDRVPEVAAIMEGEAAYMDALDAVTEAQRLLEQFRDDLDIQRDLGTESWKAGLDVRKQNLATARAAMNALRPTPSKLSKAKQNAKTFAEYAEADEREVYPRFIARVVLKPSSSKGASNPVDERAEVWLVGADAPAPAPVPGDPAIMEMLKLAKAAAA